MSQSVKQNKPKKKKRDFRRMIMSAVCLVLVAAMLGSMALYALV